MMSGQSLGAVLFTMAQMSAHFSGCAAQPVAKLEADMVRAGDVDAARALLVGRLGKFCVWRRARQLLARMLEPDPAARATAAELLSEISGIGAADAAANAAAVAVGCAARLPALVVEAEESAALARSRHVEGRAERARKHSRRWWRANWRAL